VQRCIVSLKLVKYASSAYPLEVPKKARAPIFVSVAGTWPVLAARYRSVTEVEPFYSVAREIWREAEIDRLVSHVATNPDDGELIVGTGGLRKVRWPIPGNNKGKSGGARVIFLPGGHDMPAYLIVVYAKAEQANLTPMQKKAALQAVEKLKANHRSKRKKGTGK